MINPAVLAYDVEREERVQVVEYWRSITRRKWAILALTLALTILVGVIVVAIKPVYRSTVTLLVETSRAKVVSVEEVYSGISGNREFFQTQVEIIKSREVARKVVERLDLAHNPEFDPREKPESVWTKLANSIGLSEGNDRITDEVATKVATDVYLKGLNVEAVRLSQLIKISFDSHDKILASEIANVTADTFIESDLEARYLVTKKAADWLNGRIAGLKAKLTDSEAALQEYREREKIIDAKGLALSGASKQLEDLTKNLVDVRQRRGEAENALAQVKALRGGAASNAHESIPAVIRNPLYIEAKKQEGDAERKVSELAQRYGKEHPRMVQAEGELKSARENTKRQVENVVNGLNREFEVARANELVVERSLAEARGEIQSVNRKEYQLGILEREVAGSRQIYDLFIGRSKEASATNDLQNPIARVVDRASVADLPIRPRVLQVIGLSFVVSLLASIGIALLFDRLDNTIKTTEDVELKLGVNVLATVPLVKGKKDSAKIAYLSDPQSVFAESIRTARTGVLLSSIDTEKKIIMVTSSVPNEGKTTFAMNLAFSHAQTKRVLLIDGDLRRPTIAKTLGISNDRVPGLADFISGTAQVSQVIHSIEGTTAKVMPSGSIAPNPQELLHSTKFAHSLKILGDLFDVIVIDTPPVQLVSDALLISQHASSVIYVVKADETPYQLARIGLKKIRRADAKLIGVVLNQLDFKRADRYYGEYSGYGQYGYKKYYASGK